MASRMAARSTTAGTPVKSWRMTRAGMNGHLRLAGTAGAPGGEGAHVGLGDDATAGVAQHVLEQHLDGHGGSLEVGKSGVLETVDGHVAVADAKSGTGGERVAIDERFHRVGLHGPRTATRLGRLLTGVPASGRTLVRTRRSIRRRARIWPRARPNSRHPFTEGIADDGRDRFGRCRSRRRPGDRTPRAQPSKPQLRSTSAMVRIGPLPPARVVANSVGD